MKTISELKENECMIIEENNIITFITRDISRNFNTIKEAEKEANEYNLIII